MEFSEIAQRVTEVTLSKIGLRPVLVITLAGDEVNRNWMLDNKVPQTVQAEMAKTFPDIGEVVSANKTKPDGEVYAVLGSNFSSDDAGKTLTVIPFPNLSQSVPGTGIKMAAIVRRAVDALKSAGLPAEKIKIKDEELTRLSTHAHYRGYATEPGQEGALRN